MLENYKNKFHCLELHRSFMIFHCLSRFGNLPQPNPPTDGQPCDDDGGISDESGFVLSGYDFNDNDGDSQDDGDDDCILIIPLLRLARWHDWSENNLTTFLICCLPIPFIIILIMMGG